MSVGGGRSCLREMVSCVGGRDWSCVFRAGVVWEGETGVVYLERELCGREGELCEWEGVRVVWEGRLVAWEEG